MRAARDLRARTGSAPYWDWYAELRGLPELRALAEERDRRFTAPRPEWRGGYELHRAALLNAGFEEVRTVWQELDNRVLMAVR